MLKTNKQKNLLDNYLTLMHWVGKVDEYVNVLVVWSGGMIGAR